MESHAQQSTFVTTVLSPDAEVCDILLMVLVEAESYKLRSYVLLSLEMGNYLVRYG